MRTCDARKRALLTLCLALLTLVPLGTRAAADDPTPRAATVGRGYPRAFTTYDDVVAYAANVAAQQSALDASLDSLRIESAATKAWVAALQPSPRGGSLFGVDGATDREVRLADLLDEVAAQDAAAAQLVAAGAFMRPATPWQMPTEGEITQPFGPTDVWVEPARTYGGVMYAHFHDGVDIAGAWAAPVVAPERGRVIYVGRMSDGAEIVVLAHDGGLVSMYAHLDAYDAPPPVAAGDEVAAGQRIGTVGLTGITTGEHLHWAVWRDGSLIDPLSLVGH